MGYGLKPKPKPKPKPKLKPKLKLKLKPTPYSPHNNGSFPLSSLRRLSSSEVERLLPRDTLRIEFLAERRWTGGSRYDQIQRPCGLNQRSARADFASELANFLAKFASSILAWKRSTSTFTCLHPTCSNHFRYPPAIEDIGLVSV